MEDGITPSFKGLRLGGGVKAAESLARCDADTGDCSGIGFGESILIDVVGADIREEGFGEEKS